MQKTYYKLQLIFVWKNVCPQQIIPHYHLQAGLCYGGGIGGISFISSRNLGLIL